MIQTSEIDGNLLEAEFYAKPFYFSYSSMNRLLRAPSIFYAEYVLMKKPIRTEKHLLEGSLIHFLLLEGKNFDDSFIVIPENLPSDNSVKVANEIFKIYSEKVKEDLANANLELCDFNQEILDVLETMNLHQKVGLEKRAGKIIEPKTETYFNYLKVKDSKNIIDSNMLDRSTMAAEKVKAHKPTTDLLGMNRESDGASFAAYNELPLKMNLEGLPFGLKGIIDNMTIDVEKKQVSINDFKTSNKSLNDFPETIEYWNYWLQAVVYVKLAREFFKEIIDDTWSVVFNFVVFDQYDHLYAFKISEKTMMLWENRYEEVVEAARYHYDNKDFNLPYEFATGSVEL